MSILYLRVLFHFICDLNPQPHVLTCFIRFHIQQGRCLVLLREGGVAPPNPIFPYFKIIGVYTIKKKLPGFAPQGFSELESLIYIK